MDARNTGCMSNEKPEPICLLMAGGVAELAVGVLVPEVTSFDWLDGAKISLKDDFLPIPLIRLRTTS